ncbi:DUF3500 domain-containing protein [Kineosporia sp. J2-2]|uniref:DUF3500 domain-containing protein n=1 Tax=Kineosporia corallincola TaxID=2835133 RepID=A0ABS5TBD0_9ACTN|nr:DUF3500 domain-containing protein [Kineosporia corallincola]MBT0768393.1 DUF3500 domain-containing protein [Kineosporia corallincola]
MPNTRGTADTAERMTAAARDWLDSLNPAQRARALTPWPSDGQAQQRMQEERHRWYDTPTDHGGLPLSAMRPGQQGLAMRLLSAGLSEAGYVTACTIIGLENVLDRADGWEVDWGRERGRDPQLYWLRVFGEPGPDGPWSWRFGGHHVSVQHLVLDGQVAASTPSFLGADPAASPLLGGPSLRPLGASEDLAGELVRSPDASQAALAVLARAQREVLRRLLGTFVERVPASVARREAAKYAGNRLDTVHFAWAGSTAPGRPHYFRLQGPGLLAEWDQTQREANHVHAVWRDPENDFGDDALGRHLALFH